MRSSTSRPSPIASVIRMSAWATVSPQSARVAAILCSIRLEKRARVTATRLSQPCGSSSRIDSGFGGVFRAVYSQTERRGHQGWPRGRHRAHFLGRPHRGGGLSIAAFPPAGGSPPVRSGYPSGWSFPTPARNRDLNVITGS